MNMELTKAEAIANHRKMWNWIADETLRRKRCVTKFEYFGAFGITNIPISRCYCCEYDYSVSKITMAQCTNCPILWNNSERIMSDKCLHKYFKGDDQGLFSMWRNAIHIDYDYKEAAELARQIANLPEREFPYEE